eukprot:8542388-Pyramimonas_sp.AAC.1
MRPPPELRRRPKATHTAQYGPRTSQDDLKAVEYGLKTANMPPRRPKRPPEDLQQGPKKPNAVMSCWYLE